MSPVATHDRLDTLACAIRDLRGRVVELERAAGDLSSDDAASIKAGAAAFEGRARLEELLGVYFDLAEAARGQQCPVHGEPNPHLHACPDCIRVHERRDSHVQLKSA